MTFVYNPSADYQIMLNDIHYESGLYQVITRQVITDDNTSYRAELTFCGSDKEARLFAAAQDMYEFSQWIKSAIENGDHENAETMMADMHERATIILDRVNHA